MSQFPKFLISYTLVAGERGSSMTASHIPRNCLQEQSLFESNLLLVFVLSKIKVSYPP